MSDRLAEVLHVELGGVHCGGTHTLEMGRCQEIARHLRSLEVGFIAEAIAAREAEIQAVAEGLHVAPHEVGLDEMHCGACDQWWPCDAARLLAAIGSPAAPRKRERIDWSNVVVDEGDEAP